MLMHVCGAGAILVRFHSATHVASLTLRASYERTDNDLNVVIGDILVYIARTLE